jgi:hypothetical protein
LVHGKAGEMHNFTPHKISKITSDLLESSKRVTRIPRISREHQSGKQTNLDQKFEILSGMIYYQLGYQIKIKHQKLRHRLG